MNGTKLISHSLLCTHCLLLVRSSLESFDDYHKCLLICLIWIKFVLQTAVNHEICTFNLVAF